MPDFKYNSCWVGFGKCTFICRNIVYTRHWCCTNNQNICQNIASTMDIPELCVPHSGSGVGLSKGHMHFESIRNSPGCVYLVVGLVLANGHMHPKGYTILHEYNRHSCWVGVGQGAFKFREGILYYPPPLAFDLHSPHAAIPPRSHLEQCQSLRLSD
jgi:hypothetical protein